MLFFIIFSTVLLIQYLYLHHNLMMLFETTTHPGNHFYQMRQTLETFDQDYFKYQSQKKKMQIAISAHFIITYLKTFELYHSYEQIYLLAQRVKKCLSLYKQFSQNQKELQQKITNRLDYLRTKYINPFNLNISQKQQTDITVNANQGDAKLLSIYENDKQLNIDEKIIIQQVFFETKTTLNEIYLQSYKQALKQINDRKKMINDKKHQMKKDFLEDYLEKQEKLNSSQYLMDLTINKFGEIIKKYKRIPPSNMQFLKRSIVKAVQQHNIISSIENFTPISQSKICCLKMVQKDFLILFDHPANDTRDGQNMIFIQGQITNKDNQIAVKKAICSLLNFNGGYIFFGLKKQFFAHKVVGEFLTQNQKEQMYEQKIDSWVKQTLFPSITISNKNQIHIEYIPLLKEKELLFGEKLQKQKTQFQAGKYITRIKVFARGLAAEKVYRINNGGLVQFYKYDEQLKKASLVQKEQIYKLITSNFNGYHYFRAKLQNTNKNIPRIHCHFQQEKNPQKGDFKYVNEIQQNSGLQYSPKRDRIQEQTEYENEKQEQVKFKFINLIVYQKTYQNKVLEHLKEHKIQFKIEKRFDYKICSKTHVFHHNEKFDKISNILEQLKFGHQRNKDKTKKVFLISVNPIVFYKISKNQKIDLKMLQEQVKKKVGEKQTIEAIDYPNERGVYLKSSSIDCALFVYFYVLDKKFQAKFKKLPSELRQGGSRSNNSNNSNNLHNSNQYNSYQQYQNHMYNYNQFHNNEPIYYPDPYNPGYYYDQYQRLGYFYNNVFYLYQNNMQNIQTEQTPSNYTYQSQGSNKMNQDNQSTQYSQKQKYNENVNQKYSSNSQDDYQEDYQENNYKSQKKNYNNYSNNNNYQNNRGNQKYNNYRGGNNNNRDYGNSSYRGNNRR